MRSKIAAAAAAVVLCALALVGPAHAAFPGKNGKITFPAFASDGITGGIYVADPGGGPPTLLFSVEPPRIPVDPTWSADGKRLAYSFGGIYVRDAGGTSSLGGHYLVAHPSWSPDGTRIAYSAADTLCYYRFCTEVPEGVWEIRSDGSDDHRIAPPPAADPAWSPDGSKIAFDAPGQDGAPDCCDNDIWVMNPDGTGAVNVTNHNSPFNDSVQPSWSPDGTKLAFAGSGLPYQVHVIAADGHGEAQLTVDGQYNVSTPVWSPDATRIAFSSGHRIWVMNADGTGVIRPVSGTDLYAFQGLDWQPIPEPQRSDFASAAEFCRADRAFLGDAAFAKKYGANGNGANAHGKCVSRS